MKQRRSIFLWLGVALWVGLAGCTSGTKMRGDGSKDKDKDKDKGREKSSTEIPEISDVEGSSDNIVEASDEAGTIIGESSGQSQPPAVAAKVILVKGRIRDAQNAEAIAGADLTILNAKGEVIGKPFSSTPSGSFPIPELPPGDYKLMATATGYIDSVQDFTIVENEAKTIEVLLSTVLSGTTYRAVLSWGAAPQDLDAHLKIIDVATGLVKSDIYYDNYTFQDANVKALLDIDNVEGFGPETITFAILSPGKYKLQYFVNNYNGVKGARGDITVRLYQGRSILGTYILPASNPGLTGFWNWSAFDIDVAANVLPVKAFGAPFAYDPDPLVGRTPR